jgi:hypothetical protein
MLENRNAIAEELFGCPYIGNQTASSKRKTSREEHGVKDQTEDLDQKGAASDRVEKP